MPESCRQTSLNGVSFIRFFLTDDMHGRCHELAAVQISIPGALLGAAAGGDRRRDPFYLLLWHDRHFLGGDRRVHPLGRPCAAVVRPAPRAVGLFQGYRPAGHAAGAYRRAHDHRHVRRLHRRRAVGQQHQATPAAAPHSHRAGAAGRHYRRLRRAPGDGL